VGACNSCARTLIFGSSFIAFFMLVFLSFFAFLCLSFLLPFPFFLFVFYCSSFNTFLFTFVFIFVFRLLWVSFLAHPNLLGTKRELVVVVYVCGDFFAKGPVEKLAIQIVCNCFFKKVGCNFYFIDRCL
jgi:hypothetical protein